MKNLKQVKDTYTREQIKHVLENKNNIEELLAKIDIPTLIVYADEDPVVKPESADFIFKKLKTQYKEIIAIQSKQHGILMDNTAGTWQSIDMFFQKYV